MATYRFEIHVRARPPDVFRLWTDTDRFREWIGGVTRVTDLTGPSDREGTRYTTWFGKVQSRTQVLESDPPRMIRTRFGSWLLRGESVAAFLAEGEGTRLTQEYAVTGFISSIAAWVFAHGAYHGSFRGELAAFARLAESEQASG